jgi:alkanesulfonate monooxygenase
MTSKGANMAKKKQTVFGIAMRNFTKHPEMPSARALIDYGVRMEELGYESLWAWDHILSGSTRTSRSTRR